MSKEAIRNQPKCKKRYSSRMQTNPAAFNSVERELFHYLQANRPVFYQELFLKNELYNYLKSKSSEMKLREHELFQLYLAQYETQLSKLEDAACLIKIEQLRQEAHINIQRVFMPNVIQAEPGTAEQRDKEQKRFLQHLLSQVTLDPNWLQDPVLVRKAICIRRELLHENYLNLN